MEEGVSGKQSEVKSRKRRGDLVNGEHIDVRSKVINRLSIDITETEIRGKMGN